MTYSTGPMPQANNLLAPGSLSNRIRGERHP